MIIGNIHFEDCPPNVICFQGKDISENLIQQCFDLDKNFFEYNYLYESSKMKSLILAHNELCFVFFDIETNKVIGYNFLLLLKKDAFDLYKDSKISYFTFGERDVVNLEKDKEAVLFYLSTAFYINENVYDLLSLSQNCLYYFLTILFQKYKLKVTDVLFDAVNELDLKYINVLKMNYYKKTPYNSKIYIKEFFPKKFYPYAIFSDRLEQMYNLKN